MTDYRNQPKLFKLNNPFLMFNMQLDSSRHVIPGVNRGRVSLWDYELGCIYRWVATSSYNGKQNVDDWQEIGGLHPPNFSMPNSEWFYLDTKLIVQPQQIVKQGYLPFYKGSNTWKQIEGKTRSQIMWHETMSNGGSYGCIVFPKAEWESFKKIFRETCGHLESVRYGVMYSF